MFISRIIRNILAYVLLAGVILVLGFLSFVGMLAIYPAIALAIGAVFLAALIEGEVYRQNIIQSLNKLFKPSALKKAISQQKLEEFLKERAILDAPERLQKRLNNLKCTEEEKKKIREELKKIQSKIETIDDKRKTLFLSGQKLQRDIYELEKKPDRDVDAEEGLATAKKKLKEQKAYLFLTDYQKLQHYIHKLEEHPYRNVATEEALKAAQRQLKWQKQYFNYIVNSSDQDPELDLLFNKEKDEKGAARKRVEASRWPSYLSLIASAISGIGIFFVFLHVAPMSVVAAASYFGIELSLAALPFAVSVGIYVFGVIAGAGYMLLVYNTLTKMVQEGTATKWLQKIRHFFKRDKKETLKEYISRVGPRTLGISIIALIAAVATVMMTATWWGDGLVGAGLLAPYLGSAIVPFALCTIVVLGLTTLCFNLFNSVRAADKFGKLFSLENLKKLGANEWKKREPYLKSENKWQFYNPFRIVMLAITYSFKVIVFFLHIVATGIAGDRFDKLPAWMCAIPGAINDGAVDAGFIFSEALEHHKKSHDHVHSDIPGFVLKMILFLPLLLPSAILDSLFSQLNDGIEKKKLTVCECIKKEWYGIEALSPPKTEKVLDLNFDSWRELFADKIKQKKEKIKGKMFIADSERTQLMAECDVLSNNVFGNRGIIHAPPRKFEQVKADLQNHRKCHFTPLTPFVEKLIRGMSTPFFAEKQEGQQTSKQQPSSSFTGSIIEVSEADKRNLKGYTPPSSTL